MEIRRRDRYKTYAGELKTSAALSRTPPRGAHDFRAPRQRKLMLQAYGKYLAHGELVDVVHEKESAAQSIRPTGSSNFVAMQVKKLWTQHSTSAGGVPGGPELVGYHCLLQLAAQAAVRGSHSAMQSAKPCCVESRLAGTTMSPSSAANRRTEYAVCAEASESSARKRGKFIQDSFRVRAPAKPVWTERCAGFK